jgi:hypothetical protein
MRNRKVYARGRSIMSANGAYDKPIDVTSELRRAFEQCHDPSSKRPLRRRAASEDGYGAYEISMFAGWVSDFRDIFDFFVNLPDTKKPLELKPCIWRTMRQDITMDQFLEFREFQMSQLRDLVGGNERMQVCYEVAYDRGQLDEVTTWSRAKWLFATERSFVYVDYYSVTIH